MVGVAVGDQDQVGLGNVFGDQGLVGLDDVVVPARQALAARVELGDAGIHQYDGPPIVDAPAGVAEIGEGEAMLAGFAIGAICRRSCSRDGRQADGREGCRDSSFAHLLIASHARSDRYFSSRPSCR